jgi:[acyl-carrier-protein] S-malonyltransferase
MSESANSKIAFIFPGQGSQVPGMGKSLYEKFPEVKEIFDQSNSVLGFDLKEKMFHGSEEELKQTFITQPAIFTVSSAAFKIFSSRCSIQPTYVAGHSLGEYSAFFSAGAFDFQTGIKLVKCRGEFIQSCAEKHPGTMAAILGIEKAVLQNFCSHVTCEECFCEMVNFNCPGQIVVAGTKPEMEKLVHHVSQTPGAKAIVLNVSGAFHSKLMNEASKKMSEVLNQTQISDAKTAVLTNVDAHPTIKAGEIKEKLIRQINHPVLWEDSIKKMISDGVETFIEIGPGRVLSGLMRKIDRKKKVLNVEDEESLNKTLNELEKIQAGVS